MAGLTREQRAEREAAKQADESTEVEVAIEAMPEPKASPKPVMAQNWEIAQRIPNVTVRCEKDENGALVLEKDGRIYSVNPINYKTTEDVISAFAAGGIG